MSPSSPDTSDDRWLIIKRGLYFRPDCLGYTGIRDEAGRYSHDYAMKYESHDHGVSIIRETDAPEFMPAAYNDLVIKHLIKQRDEARATPTATGGDAVAAGASDITIPGTENMDERFSWLEAKAIDMGYMLVPEPEHPDSPHKSDAYQRAWEAYVDASFLPELNTFECIKRVVDAVSTRDPAQAATPSDGAIYAAVSQRSVTPEEDTLLRQALIASTEKLYDIPNVAQPPSTHGAPSDRQFNADLADDAAMSSPHSDRQL